MKQPVSQGELRLRFLQQLLDESHSFLSSQGAAALLIAPAGVDLEACFQALDSLVLAQKINRYAELPAQQDRHCFLALRPSDPGIPAASGPQGGCATAAAAP